MLARSLCAAALLTLAAAAPAAAAKTTTAKRIKIADQQTSCYKLLPVAGKGIECTGAGIPDDVELDPYVALSRAGEAEEGQRGDFPGYSTTPVKLRAGDVWEIAGITCAVRTTRLVCTNTEKHGFRLAYKLGPRSLDLF